jgi:hypothetical protein
MLFRIGLHLGGLVEKPEATVCGDGVDIAARPKALGVRVELASSANRSAHFHAADL